jgi:hypothetical protein
MGSGRRRRRNVWLKRRGTFLIVGVAVVPQFQRGLRCRGDMLENRLQELAPLLLGYLLCDDAVRNVVHVRVSGDNPCRDVGSLVFLFGAQNEVRVGGVVCQE